jgi:hypothetical protein
MRAYYVDCKEDIMALTNAVVTDNRTHSTVFHKGDSRVNDIIRHHKKSEIIRLYDIDCTMLFRVESANVQFDMFQNFRPYIVFKGNAEGVFLEERTGLLFPNRCDQLDFRQDHRVPVQIEYLLADVELATLASNGLFNSDYSCQGRIMGNVLEIPCKIDYYAIVNTPLTYIEIQERMNLKTSTRRTGYKTLVASFLPYAAQKRNIDERPKLVKPSIKGDSKSAIRQRDLYESKAVGFNTSPSQRTMAMGADFIEVAQSRIQQRLQDAMQQGNILDVEVAATSNQIVGAVQHITNKQKEQKAAVIAAHDGSASDINRAELDAKLNDMATRMVYAGANTIPVNVASIQAKPLVEAKPVNKNDEIMIRPLTEVQSTVGSNATSEDSSNVIETKTDGMHEQVFETDAVAGDITKTLDRKKKLMDRRQQRMQIQQRMNDVNADDVPNENKASEDKKAVSEDKKENTEKLKAELKNDVLAGNVDINGIISNIEK